MVVSLETVEDTYKALADRTRLRILALLVDGEVCVCHIHDTLGLPQPTASRHLAYLRRAGLVEARREGTWMHYRLADVDPVVREIIQTAGHAMSHVAGTARDRQRFEKHAGRRLPMVRSSTAGCCAR
jgi:ArsR family transcriptional regulator